jgi:3'(2'), 5'-bisphosphate nucleotidase
MRSSDVSRVTALLKDVGQRIVKWRTDPRFRRLHSEADYKTEADRCAHDQIVAGLARLFPSIEIISEESSTRISTRPAEYWLIDPIDGTASWYHGFDSFVTQAAYIEHGVPLFGIVHAPVTGKTWTAVKGGGAYLNSRSLPMLSEGERLILTDNTSAPHGIARDVMSKLSVTGYIESGSLGLKSVLVADGTADLFVKDVCVRDWDLAPASLILYEVGGQLALSDGSPYIFDGSYEKHGGFIVARDRSLLSRVVEILVQLKNDQVDRKWVKILPS